MCSMRSLTPLERAPQGHCLRFLPSVLVLSASSLCSPLCEVCI
ncbi:hypothetical protein KP509_1Z088800 [Ceratopteris richardii]|nr:hypothetical protein KP509_1Z088800 [Ceratopteris richardii]